MAMSGCLSQERDHACSARATHVMGEGDLRIAHLALTGRAAQLKHRLHDLAHAGGADRMALTFEAAAGVHRDASLQRGLARLGTGTALAGPKEAHVFRGDDLSDGEAV